MNHMPFSDTTAPLQEVELVFPCRSVAVGHLVGQKWTFVERLSSSFRENFHQNISITYDGSTFRVRLIPFPPCVLFVVHEFGQRIFVANHGIYAQNAGAVIGKHGWWLRKTEQEQSVPCIVYHEEGLFYLKFPTTVLAQQRLDVLDNVRRKIVGRSEYLDRELSDTQSTSSVDTIEQEGPTPSEAYL
jgi:hypothetical protein